MHDGVGMAPTAAALGITDAVGEDPDPVGPPGTAAPPQAATRADAAAAARNRGVVTVSERRAVGRRVTQGEAAGELVYRRRSG